MLIVCVMMGESWLSSVCIFFRLVWCVECCGFRVSDFFLVVMDVFVVFFMGCSSCIFSISFCSCVGVWGLGSVLVRWFRFVVSFCFSRLMFWCVGLISMGGMIRVFIMMLIMMLIRVFMMWVKVYFGFDEFRVRMSMVEIVIWLLVFGDVWKI